MTHDGPARASPTTPPRRASRRRRRLWVVTGAALAATYFGGYAALRGTDVLLIYADRAEVITSLDLWARRKGEPRPPPTWSHFIDPKVIGNVSLREAIDTLYVPLVGAEIAIRRRLED